MNAKWTSYFALTLILALASAGSRADNTAETACAIPHNMMQAATYGTREYNDAQQSWNKCLALVNEQQHSNFKATAMSWAQSLDALPEGGWALLLAFQDGTGAVFGSRRHESVEGEVVTVWLRWEYRETQTTSTGRYKSEAVRVMFDCMRMQSKDLSQTFYSDNNFNGVGVSSVLQQPTWNPIIPGMMGDQLIDWACKTARRSMKAQ
jgi:hypothetical protein